MYFLRILISQFDDKYEYIYNDRQVFVINYEHIFRDSCFIYYAIKISERFLGNLYNRVHLIVLLFARIVISIQILFTLSLSFSMNSNTMQNASNFSFSASIYFPNFSLQKCDTHIYTHTYTFSLSFIFYCFFTTSLICCG